MLVWHGICYVHELFISRKEIRRKKNFRELLLQAVNSDDMFAGVCVRQKRNAIRKQTMSALTIESDDSSVLVNGYLISKKEIRDRQRIELDWAQSRYDQETRENAASTLIDALLASCESQAERIELSVNLLGYDPR